MEYVIFTIIMTVFIIMSVISIVFYVLYGISHMKALKALGYDRPWMAWIPFANNWALAELVLNGEENITFFNSFEVPAIVFKIWWLIAIGVCCVPIVGNLLSVVIRVICLGTCYIRMFARLDGTDEEKQQVIGYVSGFFTIVASCKFLVGRYGN